MPIVLPSVLTRDVAASVCLTICCCNSRRARCPCGRGESCAFLLLLAVLLVTMARQQWRKVLQGRRLVRVTCSGQGCLLYERVRTVHCAAPVLLWTTTVCPEPRWVYSSHRRSTLLQEEDPSMTQVRSNPRARQGHSFAAVQPALRVDGTVCCLLWLPIRCECTLRVVPLHRRRDFPASVYFHRSCCKACSHSCHDKCCINYINNYYYLYIIN